MSRSGRQDVSRNERALAILAVRRLSVARLAVALGCTRAEALNTLSSLRTAGKVRAHGRNMWGAV